MVGTLGRQGRAQRSVNLAKAMSQQADIDYTVHPTAEVSPLATIGQGTRIWHHAQVREWARIGQNCVLGKGIYVDHDVQIGDNCKLQNGALIYVGATLEDGVFVGPGACVANDRYPRAINPDGTPRTEADWQPGAVLVKHGASLGAGAVIVPDAVIGEWAMVAAEAVVTGNVPTHGLVQGVPARLSGFACRCGHRLAVADDSGPLWQMRCARCGDTIAIPKVDAIGITLPEIGSRR